MARRLMIAGNWKMNNTYAEAVVLCQHISNNFCKEWDDCVDTVVCPPAIDLKGVWGVFEFDNMPISVGAQNVHWEPSGAFTGEISTGMLKEIGCQYCIIGHSERRTLFGETNEQVNLKLKALLEAGIAPIVCVGESLEVRDAGTTDEFVCAQVRAAFAGVDAGKAKQCVVAYEPIWAIGTGRTATPEQAQEVCAAIRATLTDMYGAEAAEAMRVLYGGSMNPGNVEALVAQDDIDGGLIGGAALKAESFIDLVKAAYAQARK
ncbi:MAG: triose-phosphate isomerase [Coriobacteriia bacterium]|nr:triose-phosphate isomerase [Coriobacteriia bacterium]